MKIEVKVAKATQSAIPEMKKEEKTVYYILIGEGETRTIINVGKATYNKVCGSINEKPEK